jgi:Zn-dependent protease with chaperone function
MTADRLHRFHSASSRHLALVLALTLVASPLTAQTRVEPPNNRYTPEQDVELGREAAAEVREKYPIIRDEVVTEYLDDLGRRLVAVAPPELDYPVFEYSFTPVNLEEINAFALPGGPMFVNRGMIEAASTEGEVAGVMAHELAHVLLRHGTANATKAQGFQLGALAGAIAGAVVGGGWGRVISQGSQFGLGTWLLKYSREYEKQADILGAQMMARAGYDPRDLGRMFETIERESRSGSPEWLSSHPNPGNRSSYIAEEAAKVPIANVARNDAEFDRVRGRFDALPAAGSMAELERGGGGGGETPTSVGRIGDPVPRPSRSYRTVRGGDLLRMSAPSNWETVSSNSAIKLVPPNAYGQTRGQTVFTHGVEMGVSRAASRDLQESTNALLTALGQSNPDLRRAGRQRDVRLAGRAALANPLVNRSITGEQEEIGLYTAFLRDGSLFYMLTIVPRGEAATYEPAFRRVAETLSINDR